jgi:amidase
MNALSASITNAVQSSSGVKQVATAAPDVTDTTGNAGEFQDIDRLLVPAQSLASPTTTQLARLGEDTEMLNALLRYTMPFNMTGSPTITLPCGFTDAGTPLAFQFVGRHLEEEMLVRAGYAYQTATDWQRKHPVLPTD